MQEVFVRVITAIGEFRRQSQPSTWLYRIATNLCLNRVRDGRRRREHLDRFGEQAQHAPSPPGPSPDARATMRRVLAQIAAAPGECAIYYGADAMDQAE